MALDISIRVTATDLLRLFTKLSVAKPKGCWLWTGHLYAGYGRFRLGKHKLQAHRVFYELFAAKIPTRYVLDHLCEVKACCNPDHLEAVTASENVRRAFQRKLRKQRKK